MVFKNKICVIEEFVHVDFYETKPKEVGGSSLSFDVSCVMTKDLVKADNPKVYPPKNVDIKYDKVEREQEGDIQDTSTDFPQESIVAKDHLLDNILGDIKRV